MTIGLSAVLMSILILTVANFAVMGDSFPSLLLQSAYAQTPDDPGAGSDPLAGDNSTGSSMPTDNSTGPSMPSDNSTDLSSTQTDPSADLGLSTDNTTSSVGNSPSISSTPSSNLTSNAAVPEFGPLASIVLVFAVLSILVFSAKTKLKF